MINDHPDWTSKRKAGERAFWRRKYEPDEIDRNPKKGNRGGEIKTNGIVNLSLEEFKKLKEQHYEGLSKKKSELVQKRDQLQEQVMKITQELLKVQEEMDKHVQDNPPTEEIEVQTEPIQEQEEEVQEPPPTWTKKDQENYKRLKSENPESEEFTQLQDRYLKWKNYHNEKKKNKTNE